MVPRMARPPKSDQTPVAVQVRLSQELLARLDALVKEHQDASPASVVSRASVLRYLLERELGEHRTARKGAKR
jgi:metal-responsive CopG/Arc/MetJ family transcriptional regulator